jgi:phosphoglycerol geranylgeranyltransferase
MNVLEQIKSSKSCKVALLIDPDKNQSNLDSVIKDSNNIDEIAFFFIGGSVVNSEDFVSCMVIVKRYANKPIVIFPGGYHQFSKEADAFLFLNLISGRNPEYLIGQHVKGAEMLAKSKVEVISTSYILVEGGTNSSVKQVSNTEPIDQSNIDLIRKTALAGELIGHKCIFLDAGSGAIQSVHPSIVSELKSISNNPIIIGGGIKTQNEYNQLANAGANIVVIGNAFEEEGALKEFFGMDINQSLS